MNDKESRRAYYLAHREEAIVKRKAYYLAHREETSVRHKAYHLAHREKELAYHKAYYLIHKEEMNTKSKAYNLTKYGLTPISFDRLLKAQGGGCAICGKSEWNGSGPHVDHDHNTEKVRGILCHNCNVVLGLIHNDVNILQRMGDYINKFKSSSKLQEQNNETKGMME